MECEQCGGTCRESEAREVVGVGLVCPDCADDMSECLECGQLFEPELEGQEHCPDCRDDEDEEEDVEEDEDDDIPAKSVDLYFAGLGREAVDRLATGNFYAQQMKDRGKKKEDHLPRLRSEVVAGLAALDDDALRAWALDGYWGGLEKLATGDEQRAKKIPREAELNRRLDVFMAGLRRTLNAFV